MVYQVWHRVAPQFLDDDVHERQFPAAYARVADVVCEDVEQAYELTNHIDSDWTRGPQVTSFVAGARSTSIGDILLHEDGTRYVCRTVGFLRWRV